MDRKCPHFRRKNLAALGELESPDVLILGGGVNGIAVLRELALNQISAVLIEQNDFCGGASGVSTRMAHGGLRYLENRDFSLVAESARERNLLLKYASHMTAPLQVVLPVEHRIVGFWKTALNFLAIGNRRAPANMMALKLALMIYEYFGRTNRTLPKHRSNFGRSGLPDAVKSDIRASVVYFDGRFKNPEGLVFEMLEEALTSGPNCAAINHIEWKAQATGVIEIHDPLTAEQFSLKPRVVVNATGAWLDQTNSALGVDTAYVTVVKGTHIVLRHPQLMDSLGGRAFYFDDGAGRMVICNPLETTILMGTTEIQCEHPGDIHVVQHEVDYLLDALSNLFTEIDIGREHVVAAITGARPLRKSTSGDMYSATRGHAVQATLPDHGMYPVLSMVGGKWTTFRPFAERAVDQILRHLDVPRSVSTQSRSYCGTPTDSTLRPEASDKFGARLFDRYGALWSSVAEFCQQYEDKPLVEAPHYSKREIQWMIEHRGAMNLADIVLRRTTLALDGLATPAVLHEIAELMAFTRQETECWAYNEVAKCRQLMAVEYTGNSFLASENLV